MVFNLEDAMPDQKQMEPDYKKEESGLVSPLGCFFTDCPFSTKPSKSEEMAMKYLDMHVKAKHPETRREEAARQPTMRPESISRPKLEKDSDEKEFRFFRSEWEMYKKMVLKNFSEDDVRDQLWFCCSDDLR